MHYKSSYVKVAHFCTRRCLLLYDVHLWKDQFYVTGQTKILRSDWGCVNMCDFFFSFLHSPFSHFFRLFVKSSLVLYKCCNENTMLAYTQYKQASEPYNCLYAYCMQLKAAFFDKSQTKHYTCTESTETRVSHITSMSSTSTAYY